MRLKQCCKIVLSFLTFFSCIIRYKDQEKLRAEGVLQENFFIRSGAEEESILNLK